ncbi:MAG: hypothetical protein ACKE9I_03570 [Methylophagaceae bacterium]
MGAIFIRSWGLFLSVHGELFLAVHGELVEPLLQYPSLRHAQAERCL